jgi:hypothetical protein
MESSVKTLWLASQLARSALASPSPIQWASIAVAGTNAGPGAHVKKRRMDDPHYATCAQTNRMQMLEAQSRYMETLHFDWQVRPQVVKAHRRLGW